MTARPTPAAAPAAPTLRTRIGVVAPAGLPTLQLALAWIAAPTSWTVGIRNAPLGPDVDRWVVVVSWPEGLDRNGSARLSESKGAGRWMIDARLYGRSIIRYASTLAGAFTALERLVADGPRLPD